jgi:putative hydrolase of the HAD superfamily
MEELQPRVRYYPETREVLKKLDGVYKLSVASGSPRPFLKHLLRDTESHFSSIFSSTTDFQQVKTAAFYKNMCLRLQVDPEQVVHVGDHLQFDCLEPASIGIRAYYLDREGKSGDPAAVRDLAQFTATINSL